MLNIAIPIFEGFTALDAVGPYEVLSRLPGARVRFLAADTNPVKTETGMLSLNPEARFEEVPDPEVVVVPGGIGTRALMTDERLLNWIREAHERSSWTASVCTGALLLAAAGLLEGLEATTYWTELETLAHYGAKPVARRVVEQGKIITAAGVSAGIDMALTLASRIAGEEMAKAIQLGIEYDPEPPFDCGSPQKASLQTVELVRRVTGAEASAAASR